MHKSIVLALSMLVGIPLAAAVADACAREQGVWDAAIEFPSKA